MKNKVKALILPTVTLAIVGVVLFFGARPSAEYQNDKGFIFGTSYSITYQHDSNLHGEIRQELYRVDSTLSMFNKQSLVTAINRNEHIAVNSMFDKVFRMAQDISHDTDGAFDITVAPLVNAWGFGFKHGSHPTQATVDSLLQIIGYDKVALQADSIAKTDPRIMLDFSAIAKGYGCDVVADYLRAQGITNFMVEIGGEIVVSGESRNKRPWHIGVSKPTDDTASTGIGAGKIAAGKDGIQTVLTVSDIAMATSGNYHNFYIKDGRKYAHTIDPKTGHPVQHSILSATVLAPNCATADAYATAFMVMGLDKAKDILQRHPELSAYIIYSDSTGSNAVWHSPHLSTLMEE